MRLLGLWICLLYTSVAYHEAGHAVIGLKLAHANDVQKVTIIPRGSAGGYNMLSLIHI